MLQLFSNHAWNIKLFESVSFLFCFYHFIQFHFQALTILNDKDFVIHFPWNEGFLHYKTWPVKVLPTPANQWLWPSWQVSACLFLIIFSIVLKLVLCSFMLPYLKNRQLVLHFILCDKKQTQTKQKNCDLIFEKAKSVELIYHREILWSCSCIPYINSYKS